MLLLYCACEHLRDVVLGFPLLQFVCSLKPLADHCERVSIDHQLSSIICHITCLSITDSYAILLLSVGNVFAKAALISSPPSGLGGRTQLQNANSLTVIQVYGAAMISYSARRDAGREERRRAVDFLARFFFGAGF